MGIAKAVSCLKTGAIIKWSFGFYAIVLDRCKLFQIIRVGADIKIKCCACGAIIMMPRFDFNSKIKRVLPRNL